MSESSPAKDASLNTGSEVTFDIVCFTCDSAGQPQKAESYCLNCCEPFCTTCLKYHRKFSLTKHHKIIDKKNIPGTQTISAISDICTQRCQTHKDEINKYFCPTHKVLGCSVCVTLNHKLCNEVIYIPVAAADLRDSQEFKDFQNKLGDLIKKSEFITQAAKSNIKLSAEYRTKALQELETFRQELNDTLDKLKYELEHQSEEIEAKDNELMGTMAETNDQVLAELQCIALNIQELLDKKQHCKLFIDMKNAMGELTDIQARLPKKEDIVFTAVRFQPNLELKKFTQRKDAFGELLVKSPSETNATFLTDINVKSPGNTATCIVTAAVLLTENKLVITDLGNKSVKLIETEQKRIISEYKVDTIPRDVTIVMKNKVALTLPHAKAIQFLSSEDELRLDKQITFNKPCWCVAYIDDKLVVSFGKPYEVKILTMTGDVLQTFASNSQGERIFSVAPRLSVSSFNQAIYASDWEKNRVVMYAMDGNVRAMHGDADLNWPLHTAVDDTGMVYICGTNSNNIHLLTPDCRKMKILLSQRDAISCPRGICYCKMTRRLYITMDGNDNIKVFQLS